MVSMYEKIENIIRIQNEGSTENTIANVIMKNLLDNKILNQKDLAKETFTSISTITKFSKHLGLSGYLELSFLLKLEMNKYISKYNKLSCNKFEDIFSIDILKWIRKNKNFIDNFCNAIKQNTHFKINSCYQLSSSANFLKDILLFNHKNAVVINENYNLFSKFKNAEKNLYDINIIMLSGRDTFTLTSWLKVNETNFDQNKTFIFLTPSNEKKLSNIFTNKMIIDFENDDAGFIKRTLAFNYLFAMINQNI